MTVYYYIYVYACVSQEERNSLCVLLLCLLLLFLSSTRKFVFVSFLRFWSLSQRPPSGHDLSSLTRESRNRRKEKRRSPKTEKFSPLCGPKKKKIRLEPKEANQKIYKRVQLVVTTKTHVLSLSEIMFALQSSTFTGARVVSAKSAKTTRR